MNNQEITFFAKTNFRNQERVFGIKKDDRRRHMYIIGKTGMGKTNLLENMAVQDIRNGHGICYIDPHGDTAEKLIQAIPKERIKDVIYFNPADLNFPISFNVMEKVDSEYRHLVASGLVGVFKKIWADSWGPRLEYMLRNAILALLEYPGSTLLGVNRILVDKKYRLQVVEKVTDPVVKMFWVEEFSKWNERVLQEVVSPIQNKVGQFLSTSLIRNIVGQPESTFDVRKLMDERKILILNLSKGRIGEDASALLGAMMITKIQLAAMARVDMPEDDRNDFYLYVDEFQNFATLSFANILSEARKYHLNLILANQYVNQIEEEVRDAIFGNAGTIISFRVGATDAEFLEKEFEPVFLQNDIVNLPKYNIYLKLMIDGIAGDAFSATTLPPIFLGETVENQNEVIEYSRKKYSQPRNEVEERIMLWSGMAVPKKVEEPVIVNEVRSMSVAEQNIPANEKKQTAAVSSPSIQPQQSPSTKPEQKSGEKTEKRVVYKQIQADGSEVEKVLYDAKCASCGVDIKIPFKPDGKRPTFCKECLKNYQRSLARNREMEKEKELLRQEELKSKEKENLAKRAFTIKPFSQKSREQSDVSLENSFKTDRPEQKIFQAKNQIGEKPTKTISPNAYVSQDKPLSLSQMQHIAPKKFRSKPNRSQVDLNDLRQALDNAQEKK